MTKSVDFILSGNEWALIKNAALAFCCPIVHFLIWEVPTIGGVMKSAFMLGAAALVASCVFAQDVFAQRGGFREAGFRAAAPGYIGRPKIRVVVRPSLRWAGPPLVYYPYSDLPYVPVGTPAFYLAGHAGKSDSCWAWDGYQWLNFCSGNYPGF
jgi:hypothetical protein